MTDIAKFIAGLPKAELHMHLEGSLEPELMFALAQRNNVEIPFKTVDEVRAAYSFSNLQDFLDIYYQGANVLQKERDFYDLTWAYLQRVKADGVRHVEVFFDPQTHTDRGIAFSTVADGILRALIDGENKLKITSKLIMCFLRHLDEESAFATLAAAEPYLGRIEGIGLDSGEKGNPPSKFARVYEAARDKGLLLVAHAGEEGPAPYVWEALDLLDVDRIDHGNRSLDDGELVQRLVEDEMTLTVCPLSNLKLCVVHDMKQHPLKRMLDLGLRATVNSDDPAYFGGYLNDNYNAVANALNLSKADIATLARNSFIGSFLKDSEIRKHLDDIDAYAAAN
ncbi:adenosine deaminase [alpha proteobacterium U9-1i]|nr:adenosine deaminase [alpha proteobacterium U9-1i]